MPIPLLIAGVAAGLIGVGGHVSAKETNERAMSLSTDAQTMYNTAKSSLEKAQKDTEAALMRLGTNKKRVLDHSVRQFLLAYDRLKDIELIPSQGLDELSKFNISSQGAVQLQEMANIYESSFSSSAAGAAAGTLVALAASGSLPVIAGTLSVAGSAAAIGELGIAAELAGSALSFGAAMTPLAAIAAPVVLFTGLSASIKADENLEKAQVMYAEAEAAKEKMAVAETLCTGIIRKSDLFDSLLRELDGMFAPCASLLDGVTRKKAGGGRKIDPQSLTPDELKLAAVTRALAGAVKAVIDTPILASDGSLSAESDQVYRTTQQALPAFQAQAQEVQSQKYGAKPVELKGAPAGKEPYAPSGVGSTVRNVFALGLAVFLALLFLIRLGPAAALGSFSITVLLIMNTKVSDGFFRKVRITSYGMMGGAFALHFYLNAPHILASRHFWLICLLSGVAALLIFGLSVMENKSCGNIRNMVARLSIGVFFYAVALLLARLLCVWLRFSQGFWLAVIAMALLLFAGIGASLPEAD